ncbi:CheR family methyltransferase [Allocoleopsis franciscana]|uniref:protein-glutamate O-methyltransferase n=1 Tax=Allocoleopsis franciscana PCC 7113 TaxID=1173027 RepID=K9WJN1_9CYAN|nr:protein-glutamate O-methyltransferase CheR [Allocoleopsis franciscana]AFZ20026.1 methylase of chemotaxis methyl-accepting protein [Allocoleopsis franciscana PCC 7113]
MLNSKSLSKELIEAFIQLIAKHTGLEIRERDKATLSEKIALRMKDIKLDVPESYYQLLKSSTSESYQEWKKLVNLLTNSESYFFRDKDQFDLLRNHLLPELIKCKENSKTLRVCSAGCSSGEEPYSLAILLEELLPNPEEWNLTILGIDINQEALHKAELGIYRPWSFRRVEKEIMQQYFQLINHQYHINTSIKQMVKFQNLNLFKEVFPCSNSELQDLDLILCRNVFIYFEPSAIAKVLEKFYKALQPLGYLITGHAELSGQNLSQFQTKVFPESVVYQKITDHLIDTPKLLSPAEQNHIPEKQSLLQLNKEDLGNALEKNNIKMQQVALNLLKQLPPETQIPKLGNLTAAQLILQLEKGLKPVYQEPQ